MHSRSQFKHINRHTHPTAASRRCMSCVAQSRRSPRGEMASLCSPDALSYKCCPILSGSKPWELSLRPVFFFPCPLPVSVTVVFTSVTAVNAVYVSLFPLRNPDPFRQQILPQRVKDSVTRIIWALTTTADFRIASL